MRRAAGLARRGKAEARSATSAQAAFPARRAREKKGHQKRSGAEESRAHGGIGKWRRNGAVNLLNGACMGKELCSVLKRVGNLGTVRFHFAAT